jgi:hypothetical protein
MIPILRIIRVLLMVDLGKGRKEQNKKHMQKGILLKPDRPERNAQHPVRFRHCISFLRLVGRSDGVQMEFQCTTHFLKNKSLRVKLTPY